MELARWKEALDGWFGEHEAEMYALLEQLVNMDSFSHDGADVDKMGTVIADHMRAAGFAVEVLPQAPIPADEQWMASLGHVVTARTHSREAGPGVAFMGHMDTVFPAGTVAARPFRMDRQADRATGPGVLDMKGGVVMNIFVARALKELGLMDVPMTLTFSPDEELGSPTTSYHLGRELNVAHAVMCTEPGYVGGGVSVERKGSGHMLLEIEGKSAHAGRNYADGHSAILELAHKILAYDRHVDLEKDITVNTGLISGGTSANSVAPFASARIHLTYPTYELGQELVRAIREETEKTYVPGTRSHISGGLRLLPLRPTPKVMALYELIRAAADCIGYPCSLERSKGAAESGYCCSVLDLPTVCSMGPEGTGLHTPDEYIIPSTFLPRAKILALTALQAARQFSASPKVTL